MFRGVYEIEIEQLKLGLVLEPTQEKTNKSKCLKYKFKLV